MSIFSTDETIERMLKLYSVRTMKELGEALNLKRGAVSNWSVRQSIPFEILLKVKEEKDVSLDWLVTGQDKSEQLEPLERIALLAFNNLKEDGQKTSALNYMTMLEAGKIKGDFNTLWEFAKQCEKSTASISQTTHGNHNTQVMGDVNIKN